jgi:hypothetical protein
MAFVLYGIGLFCIHLMYLVLSRSVFILLKHTSMLFVHFGIILYYGNFVSLWNQVGIVCSKNGLQWLSWFSWSKSVISFENSCIWSMINCYNLQILCYKLVKIMLDVNVSTIMWAFFWNRGVCWTCYWYFLYHAFVTQVWAWAALSLLPFCEGWVHSECSSLSDIRCIPCHCVWRSGWRNSMHWIIICSWTGCYSVTAWSCGSVEYIQTVEGVLLNLT